jgi:hypothetical protein
VAAESYVSPGERQWLAWVKEVEALLGHSLDGDQTKDGYSLDFANDEFENGTAPKDYAVQVLNAEHQIAWQTGRYAYCTECTARSMKIRGVNPAPPRPRADDYQLDHDEERAFGWSIPDQRSGE